MNKFSPGDLVIVTNKNRFFMDRTSMCGSIFKVSTVNNFWREIYIDDVNPSYPWGITLSFDDVELVFTT